MHKWSPGTVLAVGGVTVLVAVVASLGVGVIHVPYREVLGVLFHPGDSPSLNRTLILEMRLPRAVGALIVGAGLGAAGCMLQALLRDPLASPTMIGTAQASGFGRVLGVFLGLGYGSSVALSFVMAVAGTMIVLLVARSRRGFPAQTVLLAGVNVGMLFAALIGLVQHISRDEGQLSRMVLMLLGGLWQVTWKPLAWIGPITAVVLLGALFLRRNLDLLALGESDARRLGQHARTVGTVVLLLACLLTSLAVSIAGIIAFVGLVVPHAARRLVGPVHGTLLPASALLGGLMVIATDCIARTAVPPNELPLGVLTSLIGVPSFLLILRSMRPGGSVG